MPIPVLPADVRKRAAEKWQAALKDQSLAREQMKIAEADVEQMILGKEKILRIKNRSQNN